MNIILTLRLDRLRHDHYGRGNGGSHKPSPFTYSSTPSPTALTMGALKVTDHYILIDYLFCIQLITDLNTAVNLYRRQGFNIEAIQKT